MGAAVTRPFAEHGSREAFVRSPAYMNLDDGHMREEWERILQVTAVCRPLTICRQSLWMQGWPQKRFLLSFALCVLPEPPSLRVVEDWRHCMLGCICSDMPCLHMG